MPAGSKSIDLSHERSSQENRGRTRKPTEEQKWARTALQSIGFLWGTDLEEKLSRVADRRAAEITPKNGIRWAWHTGSSLIFLLGATLRLSPDLEIFAPLGPLLWLASLSAHASVALKGSNARHSAKTKSQKAFLKLLNIELPLVRSSLLKEGPFGASKARPPAPQELGVSHEGAEHLCAQWLSYLGEEDVRVTRANKDGGIDILSTRCVAQVKNYQGSVGVAEIRELVGVAGVDGRFPVFFTSGSYTAAAIEFAEKASVYLFKYDAVRGVLDPRNSLTRRILGGGEARSSPEAKSAPPHCPNCDYAPAPAELACSECGIDF